MCRNSVAGDLLLLRGVVDRILKIFNYKPVDVRLMESEDHYIDECYGPTTVCLKLLFTSMDTFLPLITTLTSDPMTHLLFTTLLFFLPSLDAYIALSQKLKYLNFHNSFSS